MTNDTASSTTGRTSIRPRRHLDDWAAGEAKISRIGNYSPNATAYAVWFKDTFIGYVAGRDGGWSSQPEKDPTHPVDGSYSFVFGGASRNQVIGDLIFEARQAGVIK